MWTLGIDIGKRSHSAALLNDEGEKVFKKFHFAQSAEGYNALQSKLRQSCPKGVKLLVDMETTGAHWMPLHNFLKLDYEVAILNPLATSARRNYDIRGSKTDDIDAQKIAYMLRDLSLPRSSVAEDKLLEFKRLTRYRFELMQKIIREKGKVLSTLEVTFPEYSAQFINVFGATSMKILEEFPTANLMMEIDENTIAKLIKEASGGRLKPTNCTVRQTIPGIGPVWSGAILAECLPFFHPESEMLHVISAVLRDEKPFCSNCQKMPDGRLDL